MKLAQPKKSASPDFVFIALLGVIVIFGLVALASASAGESIRDAGNSTYYLMHQITNGLIPGIVLFLLGLSVYYRVWEKYSFFILVGAIILLLLIFTPLVDTHKGGSRWLDFGFFTFQPGEIMKLAFFLYVAAWISGGQERMKRVLDGLIPFLLLLGLVLALLLAQPATTTAGLIFVTSIIIYFTSGAKIRLIAIAMLFICLSATVFITLTSSSAEYRIERIRTFLNPETADTKDSGYQVELAKQAIGSGGLFGVGFGRSVVKSSLPEQMGDSIFPVIAEEFGFVGSVTLLLFFLTLIWRGLKIARRTSDMFGRLFVTSFVTIVGIQTFVNIGANTGVFPMTGVPLPFISYGGTSLAIFLTMAGIVANISKYRR